MSYLAASPLPTHNPMTSTKAAAIVAFFTAWSILGNCTPCAAKDPVRFITDVMAVLSLGGMQRLRLPRQFQWQERLQALPPGPRSFRRLPVAESRYAGQRIDPQRPAESLLLLKATASIPHEGGRRFRADSPEYRILANWIAAGIAPTRPACRCRLPWTFRPPNASYSTRQNAFDSR